MVCRTCRSIRRRTGRSRCRCVVEVVGIVGGPLRCSISWCAADALLSDWPRRVRAGLTKLAAPLHETFLRDFLTISSTLHPTCATHSLHAIPVAVAAFTLSIARAGRSIALDGCRLIYPLISQDSTALFLKVTWYVHSFLSPSLAFNDDVICD